jgi:hypothetical protein
LPVVKDGASSQPYRPDYVRSFNICGRIHVLDMRLKQPFTISAACILALVSAKSPVHARDDGHRCPGRRRHNRTEQGRKDHGVADARLYGNHDPLLHARQHDLIYRVHESFSPARWIFGSAPQRLRDFLRWFAVGPWHL